MRPASGCSKPAIIRSVVVLPQPDGPSIEKNSPPRMVNETSLTATTSPKRLVTPLEDDLTAVCLGAHCPSPIPIANMSLTLVPVGPVMTRSPSARSAAPAPWASRAARRSMPSVCRPVGRVPVHHRAGGVGAAVGAVGVEERRDHRLAAAQPQRRAQRGLLVRAAGAEHGAVADGDGGLAAAADQHARRRERPAAARRLAGQLDQGGADVAALALDARWRARSGGCRARPRGRPSPRTPVSPLTSITVWIRMPVSVGDSSAPASQVLADGRRHVVEQVDGCAARRARRPPLSCRALSGR